MKKIMCLLFFFLLAPSLVQGQSTVTKPRMILISIDGLNPDLIKKAKQKGMSLPNFDAFLQEGSYAEQVVGVFPTLTYPAHTSLITGVAPHVHGITHNLKFEPKNVQQKTWFWFAEDIQVPTLWDRAKGQGLSTANLDWPVSVGANIDFNIAQYWSTTKKASASLLHALSTPGLLKPLEKKLGAYPAGDWSLKGDRQRLAYAQELITTYKPDFITLYFGSLDHVQHIKGPNAQQTLATLAKLDTILGQLLTTIQSTYGNQITIALVSDHGHTPVNKAIHLNVALKKAGFIHLKDNKELSSWKAYSLAGEGYTEVRILNPKDTEQVFKLLKEVASKSENGISEIIQGKEITQLGATSKATFILTSKPQYVFRDELTGPLITNKIDYKGSHGFLPSLSDMNSSFFIMGPNIPHHKNLGTLSMLNIAPTLASLLGLKISVEESKRRVL